MKGYKIVIIILLLLILGMTGVIVWRIEIQKDKTENYALGELGGLNNLAYNCYQNCAKAKDPGSCPRLCSLKRNLGYEEIGL